MKTKITIEIDRDLDQKMCDYFTQRPYVGAELLIKLALNEYLHKAVVQTKREEKEALVRNYKKA